MSAKEIGSASTRASSVLPDEPPSRGIEDQSSFTRIYGTLGDLCQIRRNSLATLCEALPAFPSRHERGLCVKAAATHGLVYRAPVCYTPACGAGRGSMTAGRSHAPGPISASSSA